MVTYDAIGNITNVKPCNYISSTSYSAITGSENVTYQYNAQNLLSSITTASTTYTFTYDEYGNTDTISVGTYYLADYSYNSYNGKLNKITYGNGLVVRYVYDELDNVKEIWHKNGSSAEVKAYAYSYTAFGQLARFDNLLLGKSTLYKYDTSGRLVGQIEFDTSSEVIELGQLFFYRDNGRLQNAFYSADYASSEGTVQDWSHNYSYTYYDDGRIRYNNITTDITSGKIDYTYDTYNRLTTKVYNFYLSKNTSSKYTNTVSYTFVNNANNTSALVESFTSKVNSNTATIDTFTYDRNGNITKIVSSSGTETRYVYDKLGQLLREDNSAMNRTYVYSYDNAGNITSKKTYALTAEGITPTTLYSNIAYGYNDASWGDLLTSYSGNTIEYDNIGNPLTWGDYGELTWRGRQLISYTNTDTEDEITFTYNDNGIRTSKTVNGVKHTYILSGSKIISESWGIHFCIYLYDESGSPIGMQYRTSSMAKDVFYTFWFEKNLQGDIVAVYNDSGVKLITYKYDAWGNFTRTINNISGTNRSALYNPFAYRGYYYDSETGFYYVSSRYYDPEVGRFINADDTEYLGADGSVLSYNLFAYCMNDPVNRFDVDGNWSLPNWAKVAVGAVAIAGLAVATVCTGGAAAVICGAALSGAIAGGASGAVMGAVGGGISGGWQGALDGACSGFMSGTLIGGVTGAASAGLNIATGATTVVGNAHGSTLHRLATNMEAGKMAASGQYSQIGMNKALKTMGLNGTSRPDVIGVAKSGMNRLVEVVSPRQSTNYIINKMSSMLSNNPGSVGKIVNWVRRLFK